jgi:hypothetical protein
MEKRRFSRISFDMAADLIVNEKRYAFSEVGNLSVGGCLLFMAEKHFEKGTPCQFRLPLDSENPSLAIEVFGEIVRCDRESVSVLFTSIDPKSLFLLHNVIRYNAPDPDAIENEISEHPGLK